MKNYYFERDLGRCIKKAQRDLEICTRYKAYEYNATKVAEVMGISKPTVSKVLSSGINGISRERRFDMKNYYFERDLGRSVKKAQRDLEICMRYEAYERNATKVAEVMGISRTTVKKVLASEQYVRTKASDYFVRVLKVIAQED